VTVAFSQPTTRVSASGTQGEEQERPGENLVECGSLTLLYLPFIHAGRNAASMHTVSQPSLWKIWITRATSASTSPGPFRTKSSAPWMMRASFWLSMGSPV
jgi:hypothetical protein